MGGGAEYTSLLRPSDPPRSRFTPAQSLLLPTRPPARYTPRPMPPSNTLTARTADRHALYQRAVQNVEAEIDFVDRVYTKLRGRRAARLREDFCGTAASSCEWVRRRPTNTAVGIDLDGPTLKWGTENNVAALPPDARERVRLLRRNVLSPGPGTSGMDVVLSMNFSYWIFQKRADLLRYFTLVRRSLARDGVYFLDIYGGWEAFEENRSERRRIAGVRGAGSAGGAFTYVWEQERYEPITGAYRCHIHFEFKDGTALRRAFTYDWRLWTLPEVRELLDEAGFSRTTVYWEGDDGKGGGNGIFRPAKHAEQCPAFVAYLVAER